MVQLLSALLLWPLALGPLVAAETDGRPVAETRYGRLHGVSVSVNETESLAHAFYGIPFAKPPVGQLRFAAPELPEPWSGVREAADYPPMCIQNPGAILAMLKTFKFPLPTPTLSEDCLYLNVFTPASRGSAKLPVMVFIHGGGFRLGGAIMFEGSALSAIENVVVVSIQYRLGLMGFLSTGDRQISGNYGFLDQVAALRWVQENIEDFGGDRELVTIFGESAGGVSVSALVLSSLTRGLFHRAIAESGSALMPSLMEYNRRNLSDIRSKGKFMLQMRISKLREELKQENYVNKKEQIYEAIDQCEQELNVMKDKCAADSGEPPKMEHWLYDISFKLPHSLDLFWDIYNRTCDNEIWKNLHVIQLSKPQAVTVTILFQSEVVALADVLHWIGRQCKVLSQPAKIYDEEAFWNGGYTIKVQLTQENGAVAELTSCDSASLLVCLREKSENEMKEVAVALWMAWVKPATKMSHMEEVIKQLVQDNLQQHQAQQQALAQQHQAQQQALAQHWSQSIPHLHRSSRKLWWTMFFGGQGDLQTAEQMVNMIERFIATEDHLRDAPTAPATSKTSRPVTTDHLQFAGVVDGEFLNKSAEEILAQKEVAPVPFLMGVNNHEFGWILPRALNFSGMTDGMEKAYVRWGLQHLPLVKVEPGVIPLIMDEYFNDTEDPLEIRNRFLDLCSDLVFHFPALRTARYHRDAGHPVYFYEFQHRPSIFKGLKPDFVKADHGDEVFFVVGGPFLKAGIPFSGPDAEEEKSLSKVIMKYWANFACHGK
ncbi:fatty acyl-CoA hydrolase precursor, medium chain-like [Gastrophryne carolinensis]